MKTIADMLFQYCLQNRWVKAALTVTEVEAMLVRRTVVSRAVVSRAVVSRAVVGGEVEAMLVRHSK